MFLIAKQTVIRVGVAGGKGPLRWVSEDRRTAAEGGDLLPVSQFAVGFALNYRIRLFFATMFEWKCLLSGRVTS